tara:strand:- start:124 stop:654 length:531 start_codon:yes stop_codon:yes gene_type:complete
MRKILLVFITLLVLGCSGTRVQLSFEDNKSNAIRAHYQNYLNNDMDGLKSLWSPDLKVYLNSTESISLEELEVLLQAQHNTFSPIKMSWGAEGKADIGQWVETASYPPGPSNEALTVTQTWFNWIATSKLTGETIIMPAHISFVWGADGKISEEYHMYDTTEMIASINASAEALVE